MVKWLKKVTFVLVEQQVFSSSSRLAENANLSFQGVIHVYDRPIQY